MFDKDLIIDGNSFEEIAFNLLNEPIFGLKLFDFEYVSYGSPLIDLAFFLYTSSKLSDIKEYEVDFVKFYYSCISYYGVTGYTFDECLDDYFNARYIAFLRIMDPTGCVYARRGQFNDPDKNFLLILNRLLQLEDEIFTKNYT